MTEAVALDLSESLCFFHLHRRQLSETARKLQGPFRAANEFFAQAINAPPTAPPLFSGLDSATAAIENLQHMSPVLGAEPDANPCLVVLGQTKAGKSSLINALIGSEVLPACSLACTARLTRLTYGPYLRVRLRGSADEEWRELPSDRIPANLLNLGPEERQRPEAVAQVVEAEVPCGFLRSGLDLLDCPGRNENQNLSRLTDAVFKGVLPLVVYVIDGRRLLTQEDVSDLDSIRRAHPAGHVFYVVTKLDQYGPSRRPSRGTGEEMAARSKAEVFRGLVNRGLLPEASGPDGCALFHGVSLLQLARWRRKEKEPGEEPPALVRAFEGLQEELFHFIQQQLDARATEAAMRLEETSSRVLRVCLHRANTSAQHVGRMQRRLRLEQSLELAIFEHLQAALSTGEGQASIQAEFNSFLQACEAAVLRKVPNYDYSGDILTQTGPKVAGQCREDLMQFLLLCLSTELRFFMEQRVLNQQMRLLQRSADNWAPQVSSAFCDLKDGPKSQEQLKKKLLVRYLGEANCMGQAVRTFWLFKLFSAVGNFFRDLKQKVVALFRSSNSSPDVTSPEWKLEEAQRLLNVILSQDLSSEMLGFLQRHILAVHEDLQAQFDREADLLSSHLNLATADRRAIAKFVPPFAEAFAFASGVRSHYSLRRVQLRGPIGVGSQGTIHKCEALVDGETKVMALKQMELRPKDFSEQALEIFYSSSFDHPHLLPLLGAHLDPVGREGRLRLRLFSPLMAANCRTLLLGDRTPLAVRLRIARQVCCAVGHLHARGIIHRDIKLENVLLDEHQTAFVADYGLCKALGLLSQSLVGSPIHMAPELIEKALASITGRDARSAAASHTAAIDVYAFGVLLWYLVSGTGQHPRFVCEAHDHFDVLNAARFGERPERPEAASDELWGLMEACWDQEPAKRPPMEEVVERLTAICEGKSGSDVIA